MSTTRATTRPALLLLALLGVLLSGCGADDADATDPADPTTATASSTPGQADSPTPSESTSPSEGSESTEPTPSPEPTAPRELIAYAGGESIGYEVFAPEDTEGMQGAPASFKHFIARTIRRLAADSTCEAPSEVVVERLRTDGFATGGVNDCGGYHALWVQVDGRWQEVDGTQEMEGCGVLEQYRVPSDLVDGRCYDYDAQRQRDYRQD